MRHHPAPLAAGRLLIEIDYSNLPGNSHDNIGIADIRFGQTPPPVVVPEPSTALLLGIGLAAVLRRARRS